jgi:lipid A 3-O-deacylase
MGDLKNDYNHGTEATWSEPLADASLVARGFGQSSLVQALLIEDEHALATYAIGQIFFTPVDIKKKILQARDRPFAAWLYTGLNVEATDLDRDASRRHDRYSAVGFKLGIVGPSALGKQVHTEWHKTFGLTQPGGWDNQIKDEPGYLVTVDRLWRYGFAELGGAGAESPWQFDSIWNTGLSLGNIRTEARIGGELRFGEALDRSWGSRSLTGLRSSSDWVDWSFFLAGETHIIAQDIFLEGNTSKSSHSVEKETNVTEIGAGIRAQLGDWSIGLGNYLRTEEFDGQLEPVTFWTLDIRIL